MSETTGKKKLIEVALPLDEINAACRADKDRKTGTLRNIHKWFAPMPLPAWRALLFAALVDDPAEDNERVYLLDVIKRLVGNGADLPDGDTLEEASALLQKQFPDGAPLVMDPFCGGGSTLVEAQRLGLHSVGSDLNPVPVLITRTLTELLPKVHGRQPLHAAEVGHSGLFAVDRTTSSGYEGIAADTAYYAEVVRSEAAARLKPVFPETKGETAISWFWARTATCPNPTCGIETVLTTTWWLSKRKGALSWIEPRVDNGSVVLKVVANSKVGEAPVSPKVADGVFVCLSCKSTLNAKYLREQGRRGSLGQRMTAVMVEKGGTRTFRAVRDGDVAPLAGLRVDGTAANVPINIDGQGIRVGGYGINTWEKLFTPRQLLTLATFADCVAEIHPRLLADSGEADRADVVTTLLALALGKLAQGGSTQTRWKFDSRSGSASPEGIYGRADLPMTWDFVEVDGTSKSAKSWTQCVETMLDALPYVAQGEGVALRADARVATASLPALVATDPPYFEAIGYADLSDFFYIWHRKALRSVHPDLYPTLATPKVGELAALPSHHGNNRDRARAYFIEGFTEAFINLQQSLGPDLPMLVVYASKEQKAVADEQTRWASILTAIIDADMQITATWPIHGTGSTRMRGQGSNAVATYIVMACRSRPADATTSSVNDFTRTLRRELGPAVRDLQAASILPVDLDQAALGPGMQIFSRHRAVLDQAGERVSVGRALDLINTALSEVLDEQLGDLDPESRFAVRWWEIHGWSAGPFADADKAARPLGISVDDVKRAQVAAGEGTRIKLLGEEELDRTWVPSGDIRPTAWEAVHHLVDRLIRGGGELEAAQLIAVLGPLQDPAVSLTYRLHDIAAAKGRVSDQERYNALINSWTELVKLSASGPSAMERMF